MIKHGLSSFPMIRVLIYVFTESTVNNVRCWRLSWYAFVIVDILVRLMTMGIVFNSRRTRN